MNTQQKQGDGQGSLLAGLEVLNNASVQDLRNDGFSEGKAESIVQRRNDIGGKFKSWADVELMKTLKIGIGLDTVTKLKNYSTLVPLSPAGLKGWRRLNNASTEDLVLAYGFTEAKAKSIVQRRKEIGGKFVSLADLDVMETLGILIGAKTVIKIKAVFELVPPSPADVTLKPIKLIFSEDEADAKPAAEPEAITIKAAAADVKAAKECEAEKVRPAAADANKAKERKAAADSAKDLAAKELADKKRKDAKKHKVEKVQPEADVKATEKIEAEKIRAATDVKGCCCLC
mmetsp:Transcript_621/g.1107  ORF Transcript_621/g.1107 Transcript_621/m.1107 type:complete len:288 (+) Transcript_621:697-1560(+)